MTSLATACAESYNRAYPFLVRLHILREAEHAYELVHCTGDRVDPSGPHWSSRSSPSAAQRARPSHPVTPVNGHRDTLTEHRYRMMSQWGWKERLDMLSPSVRHRSVVLAFRRSVLSMCDMKECVADNWMSVRYMGDLVMLTFI